MILLKPFWKTTILLKFWPTFCVRITVLPLPQQLRLVGEFLKDDVFSCFSTRHLSISWKKPPLLVERAEILIQTKRWVPNIQIAIQSQMMVFLDSFQADFMLGTVVFDTVFTVNKHHSMSMKKAKKEQAKRFTKNDSFVHRMLVCYSRPILVLWIAIILSMLL